VDVHDKKQFEIKLEYEPRATDSKTRYLVEAFFILPASLNVDAETYPRQAFYADIHNYVRLKTPVFTLEDLLGAESSPLVRLEKSLAQPPLGPESELVYQAKLLACVFRGALRRFVQLLDLLGRELLTDPNNPGLQQGLALEVRHSLQRTETLLGRFREFATSLHSRHPLEEKTPASLRLVDEYMSVVVEQLVRKAVANMDLLPRTGIYAELRKEMMGEILREEAYRKQNQLRSVLSPTGDNEEYVQRLGFLKKFCNNILFLAARREQARHGWEELLLAIAAGLAMAFATAVALWAQIRFSQVSYNFFLIVVIGYMMKDRIKEGLRRIFTSALKRHLFDRVTLITEPVTKRHIGWCREKLDYDSVSRLPDDISQLRCSDDALTVSKGELAETLIHYQKEVILASELLPKRAGQSGVTDIIRFNVGRLLRDMDDPEHALEYVDLEDFSVGHVRAAKRYQVDVAFRFCVDQGRTKRVSLELARLVLDRDGIRRMINLRPEGTSPTSTVRSAA
jgi:hypothetical protein